VEHTIIQETESLQSFLPSDGIRVVRSGVKPHAIKDTILLYIPLHTPSYTLLKQIPLSFTVLLQMPILFDVKGEPSIYHGLEDVFLFYKHFLFALSTEGLDFISHDR
jgi:hypothetical protein